jgi:hypothetical protein
MIGSSAFGSFDEPTSLSGEFDPSGLSGINGYPLFHQPAMAWVEVSTLTSADELIDPFSRKLGDKPALHEHRKKLYLSRSEPNPNRTSSHG